MSPDLAPASRAAPPIEAGSDAAIAAKSGRTPVPQAVDPAAAAAERGRSAGRGASVPLPSPEKVFADWLLWLPQGVDVRAAAREQIARIDRHGSAHPDVRFLRTLLVAAADGCPVRKPFSNL
jgi:hypothetical protein